MLKLGEKGAIIQRDKETYAIAPHITCGVVTPDLLRKLADVAEKYQAKALKITGAPPSWGTPSGNARFLGGCRRCRSAGHTVESAGLPAIHHPAFSNPNIS